MEAFKLSSGKRLEAAKASEQQASDYLSTRGFDLQRLLSSEPNRISFKYDAFDEAKAKAKLGEPVVDRSRNFTYTTKEGRVVVKTMLRTVVLLNSHAPKVHEIVLDDPSKPKPVDEPVSKPDVRPGSHMNEDSHVPEQEVADLLAREFEQIRQHPSKGPMIQFMTKLWKWFNQRKFHNKLPPPNAIGLMRDAGKNFSTRGRWFPKARHLEMSPRMFNASIDFFLEIFLHEMCHQAVTDIDGGNDGSEGGHGPEWKAWMVRVGLDPRRYDPTPNTEFHTRGDMQKVLNEMARSRGTFDQRLQRFMINDPRSVIPLKGADISPGRMVVVQLDSGKYSFGVIVAKLFGVKSWYVLTTDYLRAVENGMLKDPVSARVPDNRIFTLQPDTELEAIAKELRHNGKFMGALLTLMHNLHTDDKPKAWTNTSKKS